jgi:transcription initiation factor IIF auxiliary subunit
MAASLLKIVQSEKYEGDEWWRWAVWVEGPDTEIDQISRVEYTLHPTFRHPVRIISTRRNKFKLATSGWGVFPVYARVFRKDGSTVRFRHQLTLHYPDGTNNTK